MAAHLAAGAGVCCPPAIHAKLRTFHFLTWLDLSAPLTQRFDC